PNHLRKQAIESEEGEVSVAGYWAIDLSRCDVELGPSPLVGVTIPIADHHVEKPCADKSSLSDPLIIVFDDLFKQLGRPDYVLGEAKAGLVRLILIRPGFERGQHAGKSRAIDSQTGIIRYVNQRRARVIYTGCIGHLRQDQ